MSKRTLIFAALAIVLFIVSLFSVVYDFKPAQEPEPEPEFNESEFNGSQFTETENQENIDQAKQAWINKLKAGKEAARVKREQEKNTEIISGNGTEQATN